MSGRMVPVFLKPSKDRNVVVFGGGKVALRKCMQFAGFCVTVVADAVVPGIEEVCDRVILAHFNSSDLSEYLEGAFISVAATDSHDLNREITRQASSLGILSNSAHGDGDLLLPSSVRKRGYTVAVSSEGSAPAFPPYVKDRIDEFLGEEYDLMLELLVKIRGDLRMTVSEQPRRAECLAEILHDDGIWYLLKDGKTEEAKETAFGIMETYSDARQR